MLIIFDCDGVLVDSEPLAAQVFSDLLAVHDIPLSATQCYASFHGHTLDYCFAWIEKTFGCQLPAGFGHQLAVNTRDCFTRSLQPITGVVEVLEMLKQRSIAYCVASNGEHSKIEHSLAITGLDKYFPNQLSRCPRRFSRADVGRGKPSPDLFLHAAEVVGVPPRFCTVVEDSVAGFSAAKAAGMKLLRFVPQKAQAEQGCVRSMGELFDQLNH